MSHQQMIRGVFMKGRGSYADLHHRGPGVLGKAVVPGLLADGHVVYALSRSETNKEVLQRLGAKPVPADLFDGKGVGQALVGCRAEAILNLATSNQPTTQIGRSKALRETHNSRQE